MGYQGEGPLRERREKKNAMPFRKTAYPPIGRDGSTRHYVNATEGEKGNYGRAIK